MRPLSKRTDTFSESGIRSMTFNENYSGAINLGQGYPDFDPPAALLERLHDRNLPHQYELTPGSAAFRDALSKKQSRSLGRPIDPDAELLVTNGSTEAMMTILMTLLEPGETVAVFSPYYENYISQARLLGASIDYVELTGCDFSIDFDRLEDVMRKRPKVLILCNPSNPSGKVFTRDELLKIAAFAEKYDVYIVTDEVYEHIVYDGREYVYFQTLPGMWDRTAACGSLSKTYSITGWRLGYAVAGPAIIRRAKKVHDFLAICAPAPLQYAAIAGLLQERGYYDDLTSQYQRRKEIFTGGLRSLGWEINEPQGAYYVLANIARFKPEGDLAFCRKLAREYGVLAVPGYCFRREERTDTVRFHFAKTEEALNEALNRLEGLGTRRCF
ncbi:MAG: pyridoxal phosphate-dependent aminotransferase [Synergistaceae bacterium]|jgi:aminotransferase|nr:pyridoxal phosphate-dependent aminotransferase [Synergistaceae bacterium]